MKKLSDVFQINRVSFGRIIYLDTCKQACNHITESPVNRTLDTPETTDSSLSIQFGGQLMERKTVIYKVRRTSKEFKKAYRTCVLDDEKSGEINKRWNFYSSILTIEKEKLFLLNESVVRAFLFL